MSQRSVRAAIVLICLLFLSRLALPHTLQQNGRFSVSSHEEPTIAQIKGGSYGGIEVLARLTNPSLRFNGPRITLTPSLASASVGSATPALERHPASPQFSKVFMKAGIEEMAAIRDWRSALLKAARNGYPVTEKLVAGFQSRAITYLSLASVAASTDSDAQAFQLLSNQFDNMQRLSDKIVTARENMNYVAPHALRNDPLYQQVLDCGRSLASMTSHGQFQDDGSCQ